MKHKDKILRDPLDKKRNKKPQQKDASRKNKKYFLDHGLKFIQTK